MKSTSGTIPPDGAASATASRAGSRRAVWIALTFLIGVVSGPWGPEFAAAQAVPTPSAAELEFFEAKIRPVLVEHCYACHNSTDLAEGELAVDWRNAIRAQSQRGTAVVPGDPANSLLLKVIRHEIEGLEMPDGGAPLSAAVIADFEKWIAAGAEDPRSNAPDPTELAADLSWESKLARRRQWWSLQPVGDPEPPGEGVASTHPVDQFIARRLSAAGLSPAPPASREVLLRRLAYALTGLPPTPEEIDRFVADPSPMALETEVDRLLDSPRFGERWARHWMDLVRYADSHGSEGDPLLPHAWQYRDYLIRAFNQDVPYDQLVREHLAGDLLTDPRINRALGINESAIGPAHLRFVFHGFAPTDALDEKVRFTDDQINVFGKMFLGLTISCARCHDHKFDAISQADYYALFGVFASCRPAMRDVAIPEREREVRQQLLEIQGTLRDLLGQRWHQQLDRLGDRLSGEIIETDQAPGSIDAVSGPWRAMRARLAAGESFAAAWAEIKRSWQPETPTASPAAVRRWDFSVPDQARQWFARGNGLEAGPQRAGSFAVADDGDLLLTAIYPAGWISHSLSRRHRAVLESPRFRLDGEYDAWFHLIGGGASSLRYVIQNYPRDGTVYPIQRLNQPDWSWQRQELGYWRGDEAHFEFATARDAPLVTADEERSWFGVREVILLPAGSPPPPIDPFAALRPLLAEFERHPVSSMDDLLAAYRRALETAVDLWQADQLDDSTALFLNACLRDGILENSAQRFPAAASLVQQYRHAVGNMPSPVRVPGVAEADPFDQPLMVRGDHRNLGESVPRRFLEVLEEQPFETELSGRLELADALLHPDNPLTSRVIVNRIWHHLFGRGIVATPDNFGQLGELPTHPELLDFLARRLVRNGWSIKETIRFLVLSKTWQQSSEETPQARDVDPANELLSHAHVRRLDAESIRDSLLWVSGQWAPEMYGPGAPANSVQARRSVYLQTRRNDLDAFLQTFDAPVPFSTTGRRSTTNVPAQSLTMLNDPQVWGWAEALADRIWRDPRFDDDPARRAGLFRAVLGRPPGAEESNWLADYAAETREVLVDNERRREEWTRRLERTRADIEGLLEPVRTRLLMQRVGQDSIASLPPLARWQWTSGFDDQIGDLDAVPVGDVTRTAEGLTLNGRGFARTPPLSRPLHAKTLESWLRLNDLDQRGGGVVSLQDLGGNQFDAIVFGEQTPRQWMAGSEFFHRTRGFAGSLESEPGELIHVALVYRADGTVAAYRNGRPYGEAYPTDAQPLRFEAGESRVVFGIRHGNAVTPGRMLTGTLVESRIYDRALSDEEVAASYAGQSFVLDAEVLAALTTAARAQLADWKSEERECLTRLDALGPTADPDRETWIRLAHALFNTREFLYLR